MRIQRQSKPNLEADEQIAGKISSVCAENRVIGESSSSKPTFRFLISQALKYIVIFAVLTVAFMAWAIAGHAPDAAISVALNKLVGLSSLTDKALVQIQGSNLIGSLIVALIWLCWFRFVGKPERIRICVGDAGNLWGGNPLKIDATVPEIPLASGVRHVLKSDSCHGSAS